MTTTPNVKLQLETLSSQNRPIKKTITSSKMT